MTLSPSLFSQLSPAPPLFLARKATKPRPNQSSSEPMNRPGTSSITLCISGLIINHRSTSSTTAKSRSCSWHRWPFQRPISICSPSTTPRVSRTRPPEPPHNTKFGPSARTWICPAAYPRFSFRRRDSPATAATATISITAISRAVTLATPSATPTSHKRASEPVPFTEHDT